VLRDELSPAAAKQLEEMDPDAYYTSVGYDGRSLRVPTDLDKSICCYLGLSPGNRADFGAIFWMDMASGQWDMSVSASFAALVSAIESLTKRGEVHGFTCPVCGGPCQHDVPGATKRFRDF